LITILRIGRAPYLDGGGVLDIGPGIWGG